MNHLQIQQPWCANPRDNIYAPAVHVDGIVAGPCRGVEDQAVVAGQQAGQPLAVVAGHAHEVLGAVPRVRVRGVGEVLQVVRSGLGTLESQVGCATRRSMNIRTAWETLAGSTELRNGITHVVLAV